MAFRKIIFAVITGCTALSPSSAQEGALTLGIGNQSCAYWQSSPSRTSEGTVWIFGFWSAYNHANERNHQVGRNTDPPGNVAEVKKTCDARPSMLLIEATVEAYFEMAKRDAAKPKK
jgi:hypothetical protein